MLIGLLTAVRGLWAAQIVLVLLLLIVPGVILLRALRVPGKAIASFPAYVPAASLIVLLVSGLAVDWTGLLAGNATPLRLGPLLVGFELICFALLAASARVPTTVAIPWRSLSGRASLVWPLILPVGAAAGALRLNNGHSNAIALATVFAGFAMLITVMGVTSRLTPARLAVFLYAIGLAMTWSHSLRSDLVNGFDIGHEYYLMHQTVLSGVWYIYHVGDAYGAMLSVTILPTELHTLSGVPDLMVFKIVYPALYALFPVAIFGLARRLTSRRWAFVAASFTIGLYSFPEIAGFARQEIAFIFFVSLAAAMLDSRIPRRSQWALVVLLGLALAVSHYSTTYMAIAVFGLTLSLQWAASWFRDIPRVTGAVALAFATLCIGTFVWYGPVTHSASGLAQFVRTVQSSGFSLLPNRGHSENLIAAYLKGTTRAPIPAGQYQKLVRADYLVSRPYVIPFADASLPQYALRDSPVPEPPVIWRLGYDLLKAGALILAQLANVFAVAGALWMVLGRRASAIARQFGLLALATVGVLSVIRVSGAVAIAYGQERAQIQAMVLLAITLGWAAQALAGRRARRHVRVFAATIACLAVILVNTTYLEGAVLGGGTADNLANSGADYEYFYTTVPELSAARWLGKAASPGQLVYADEYAQVPLVAMTGIQNGLLNDVTPLTLNQHAWVYADTANVVDGRAFALYQFKIASYIFPSRFLDANYDTVYTNGSAKVYYR